MSVSFVVEDTKTIFFLCKTEWICRTLPLKDLITMVHVGVWSTI